MHRIANDVICHRNFANERLQRAHIVLREGSLDRRDEIGSCLTNDGKFLGFAGIVDEDVEHETVELGLGERIGPFLLNGVLRGQNEERLGEFVPLTTDRHLRDAGADPPLHRPAALSGAGVQQFAG